jgi:putative ABC transport system permease protein
MASLTRERGRAAPRPAARHSVESPSGPRGGPTLLDAIQLAVESLSRHAFRTLLAVLGIIIGVGSVMTTMALAEGTRREVLAEVRLRGSNLLSVRPGEQRQGAVRLGEGSRASLSLEDVEEIIRSAPAVVRASPVAGDRAQVKGGNENTNSRVTGVTSEFFGIRNYRLLAGRVFTPEESQGRARLCLISHYTAEVLFGTTSPVGKRLKVKGQSFRVIGVVRPADGDPDDEVWVPVRTLMGRLAQREHIDRIELQARDEASLGRAAAQVEAILRRRHELRPDQENDFQIRNQQDRLEAAEETSGILTRLLVGVGAVSLLVGGIGIMNIMLVSVTERTREIGIRRAVGARRKDILTQFLVEALVMCGIGGSLGILCGIGATWLGAVYAGWAVAVTPEGAIVATGFAVGIGFLFGLFPALRASRLLPITALRSI